VFQKNFFADFKEAFETSSVIKHFDKCDFSLIKQHLDLMKSLKKAATDEEKEKKKREKEQIQLQYGYALIDGRIEKVFVSYCIIFTVCNI
jgi:DNA topoisomerase-1